MSKVDLSPVPGAFASLQAVNNRFAAIEEAFNNTLSRDGSLPNSMNADLDMDSNDIINVNHIFTDALTVGGKLYDGIETGVLNITVLGSLASEGDLPTGADIGDAYIINQELWLWNGTEWANLGNIQGPEGPQGPMGPVGPQGPQGPKGEDSTVPGPQGPTGLRGKTWFSGEATPTDASSVPGALSGDYYFQTGTGLVWLLVIDNWNPIASLMGPAGADGVGIPAGGSAGQALVKASAADYDTEWSTVGGSGGATVHGDLTGLEADDHPQYYNEVRGDARYIKKLHTFDIATRDNANVVFKEPGATTPTWSAFAGYNSLWHFDLTDVTVPRKSAITIRAINTQGDGVPNRQVGGVDVFIHTQQDNGGAVSGFFAVQTGGANAATFYVIPDGKPDNVDNMGVNAHGFALECATAGTGAGIFVLSGIQTWSTHSRPSNAILASIDNNESKGILVRAGYGTSFDNREAFCVGDFAWNTPLTSANRKALIRLDGRSFFKSIAAEDYALIGYDTHLDRPAAAATRHISFYTSGGVNNQFDSRIEVLGGVVGQDSKGSIFIRGGTPTSYLGLAPAPSGTEAALVASNIEKAATAGAIIEYLVIRNPNGNFEGKIPVYAD